MRLQQLYVQVRIQVINGQYALTNDRAALQAAQTASEYNTQAYQAEVKKLRLGASTTANVLLQEKNVAAAENNVISTEATYAKDRASLDQLLAETLDRYGISLTDAVTGQVTRTPVIPGIEPAKSAPEAALPGPAAASQGNRTSAGAAATLDSAAARSAGPAGSSTLRQRRS